MSAEVVTAKDTLNPFDFGRQLIQTGDLDPVYIMLHAANLPPSTLKRWLLAYFYFYHAGTSSWIVEQGAIRYWDTFHTAAKDATRPRSPERRHFRGAKAIKAVEELRKVDPVVIVDRLTEGGTTLTDVVKKVKQLPQCGGWIAFKVADMLERLGLSPIHFSPLTVFDMYEAPTEGAQLMYDTYGGDQSRQSPCMWAYNQLVGRLNDLKAPPRYERMINIQEIETILCKWKSHMNGNYPVGKDCKEIQHGLLKYSSTCLLAKKMLDAGASKKLWLPF